MNILYHGMYFMESTEEGCCILTHDKSKATECIDFADCEAYIKDDMKMRFEQVSIKDNSTTYKYNKEWYNHNLNTVCNRCGKTESRININKVATINGEEELCAKCYSDLESSVESYDDIFEEE